MHSTLRTLLAVSVIFAGPAQAATVYAAASLTDVLDAITEKYQQTRPADIRLSYASSSTLARQIEAGAPADLYISADEQWMDYLSERDLIDKDSRRSLLRNRLVMIAPPNAPPPPPFGAVMRASDGPASPNGWLLEICRAAATRL